MTHLVQKIWIDLDNSPHVPFFVPIVRGLEECGFSVVLTGRDCFQVRGLVELAGLHCKLLGRHYGKNKVLKLAGTCFRAAQLCPFARSEKPSLAISHGSRSQLLTSALFGIPHLLIDDYEFSRRLGFIKPTWLMVPEVIPKDRLDFDANHVLTYAGIKEDVYVPEFVPDSQNISWIHRKPGKLLITVRPPACDAHYHDRQSDELFHALMSFLIIRTNLQIILLPRNEKQATEARSKWACAFGDGKIFIPPSVVDGLSLIWFSDLVISGGGTMNREAAALGVPVYSIFRGRIGAVDRYLARAGRLVLLESVADLEKKIVFVARRRPARPTNCNRRVLAQILSHINAIMGRPAPGALSSQVNATAVR